jgi:2'-5' RNA ligase
MCSRTARLFVAVWPSAGVLDRVAALDRPDVAGVRWTDRSQWHVTLRFLGRADVGAARAGLTAALVTPAGEIEAAVGPEVGRFGHRILHVPVSGLDVVAAAVASATAGVGEPPEGRPFAGHLTLARAGRSGGVDLRRLTGQAIAGTWPVTEVCLVESRLSSAGARYEVLSRHSLTR